MSTASTETTWYWYIRQKGRYGYLGLVDENGDAPTTSSLNIDIYYQQFPDEIESDNDIIGLPEEFLFALAKGTASEILKVNGAMNALTQQMDQEFERAVYDAIHKQVEASQQPAIQAPINLLVNE